MTLNRSGNVSGRLAIWAIVCLNILASFIYLLIPENDLKDHFFYIVIEIVFLLGTLLICRYSGFDVKNATGITKKVDGVGFLYVFVMSVGLLYFGSFFANIIYYALEALGYVAPETDISVTNITELVLSLITVAVLPAVSEEVLLRGGIFPSLRNSVGTKKAIILSALFFALLHGSVVQTVHQFIIGAFCALLLIGGGSILYCIALHFFNNAIAVVMTYLQPALLGAESVEMTAVEFFALENLIPSAVISVVGFIALVFALCAFLRRMERKRNLEYIPEKSSISSVLRRAERIEGRELSEKSESVLEKILFFSAVAVTLVIIVVDMVRGFIA